MDVCVYSCLTYLACKSRIFYVALYCHDWLFHIFPHCLINGTIFEKKIIEHKNACFDFLCNFCLKYFSLRIQRDIVTNVPTTSSKVLVFLVRFY